MLSIEVRVTIRDVDEYGLARPVADVTRKTLTAITLASAAETAFCDAADDEATAAVRDAVGASSDFARAARDAAAYRDVRHAEEAAAVQAIERDAKGA